MKPLGEAQAVVLDTVSPLPVVSVPLGECLGLALAEAVVAGHDLPPFANSAVDGYAVRVGDVVAVPVELHVVGNVAAGSVPLTAVTPGSAVKVMTGALLPDGAEAVVRVEDTETADGVVRILVSVPSGLAIRPAGGDVPAGTEVMAAGERLAAAHLGVLASLGVSAPRVRRRPVVALLSTGDELVPVETVDLSGGLIRDANRSTLAALITDAGAVVVDHGIVGDDPQRLRRVLDEAAGSADVIVSSGGVSMGDHDVVKEMLIDLGTVDFWQVAMQPAKPLGFGSVDGVPFFGLPGNPVSVYVAFEQFVRPALLTMLGAAAVFRPRVRGVLDDGASTDPAKTVFLRTVAAPDPTGAWHARSAGGQASNVLSAMAAANAFAVIPVGCSDVAAGAAVDLELFTVPSTRTRREVLGG
ncbi:MAG: molybdopterin molybdotransferase MoeA [Acidimicrobiia bacterium]|nr:molybdopterin molybdotransferase MoeA [Acidimicrobiia bacterium]